MGRFLGTHCVYAHKTSSRGGQHLFVQGGTWFPQFLGNEKGNHNCCVKINTQYCCLQSQFLSSRCTKTRLQNITSYFAPEVAKYPKSSPKPRNSPKQCASLLSRSVSDTACFFFNSTELLMLFFVSPTHLHPDARSLARDTVLRSSLPVYGRGKAQMQPARPGSCSVR